MIVNNSKVKYNKSQAPCASDIVLAQNVEQIEAMRSVWQKMQGEESYPAINSDIDRYLSVVRAAGDAVQPHIILLQQEGCPAMLVIGRIEKHRLDFELGYKRLFRARLKCLTIVYEGFIGQVTRDMHTLLFNELMRLLRSGRVDMIFFNHLKTESPTYQFVREMAGNLWRSYFPKVESHWQMSIPENIDLFYKARSTKHRSNLRKFARRLEKAFPGKVNMVTYHSEEQLDEGMKAASAISARTYQHAIGCGFVDDFKKRTLLSTAAKHGWLRMYVLYIDGHPTAYQLDMEYHRTHFGVSVGYDPEWKGYRVGTLLFLRVLEELCREQTVDYYDFGFGDAHYKKNYCDQQWQEAFFYIFAPRLYPMFINIFHSSLRWLSLGLSHFLNKTGIQGRLKRRWRNLLQAKAPVTPKVEKL